MKKRREAENEALEKALEEADLTLWDIAEQLHKQFPKHPVKYYYQRIMRRSNLKRQRRKVSLWNAFVSQEMRKYNDGMVYTLFRYDPISIHPAQSKTATASAFLTTTSKRSPNAGRI